MNEDVLIEVNQVSKRFCKDLKRSILYGFSDSMKAIVGKSPDSTILRKDEFWAVKDVSFQLRRGECLGLIGHNGAGKSTLLKMLNGLIRPDHGQIIIRGKIAALIELGAGFNPILTGRENIYNNGAVLGFTRNEITEKIDDIIDFAEIREFIDSPVQNYSSGMKVRLGFAVAAQMEPDVLLIDEVLAVGDVGFTIKCLTRIAELLKKCAVIFVSHAMPQVGKICTSALLMNHGQSELYSHKVSTVIEAYYSDFDTEKASIFGNGKAYLSNLTFKSTDYNSEKNIVISKFREELSFQFELSVDRSIKDFFITLVFFNQEFRSVAIVSTLLEFESIKNNLPIYSIKACVENCFSPGKYSVSIEILERIKAGDSENEGEYLLSMRNVLEFLSIGSTQPTYCSIQEHSRWTIN